VARAGPARAAPSWARRQGLSPIGAPESFFGTGTFWQMRAQRLEYFELQASPRLAKASFPAEVVTNRDRIRVGLREARVYGATVVASVDAPSRPLASRYLFDGAYKARNHTFAFHDCAEHCILEMPIAY